LYVYILGSLAIMCLAFIILTSLFDPFTVSIVILNVTGGLFLLLLVFCRAFIFAAGRKRHAEYFRVLRERLTRP
jgi:hypothetical protein